MRETSRMRAGPVLEAPAWPRGLRPGWCRRPRRTEHSHPRWTEPRGPVSTLKLSGSSLEFGVGGGMGRWVGVTQSYSFRTPFDLPLHW